MRKIWILGPLFILLLALPLMAACGGDEAETSTTAAAVTTTAAAPATTAAGATTTTAAAVETTTTAAAGTTAQYGGVLRLRTGDAVNGPLGDPNKLLYPGNERVNIALEPLLYGGEQQGTYDYILATDAKLAPDKSYYDLTLRQGVKFHDGTDFNAAAAKWNLDRALALGIGLRTVKSIDVVDDYTIRLNLSSWTNEVLNDLGKAYCLIVSPTAFEKNGEDGSLLNPVGTGPFKFKEIRTNQAIVYEKNPDYWEEGRPYLDGLEVVYIPEPLTAEAALENGELEILGSGEHAYAKECEADYNVFKTVDSGYACFYMNTTDPASVWSDVRMRQAFEYALDKENTLSAVGGAYNKTKYVVISGLEDATDLSSLPERKYDPAKAKELIAAAGHADGVDFTFYVGQFIWSNPMDQNVYLGFQEQLAEVGLNMEIQVVEWAKQNEMFMNPLPGSDVMINVSIGSPSNPLATVADYLANPIQYVGVQRPPEFAALVEQSLQSEDPAKTLELLVQMETLTRDQAMIIPLYQVANMNIATKAVHDAKFSLSKGFYELKNAWMEQ